ncbi:hypothetical protein D9M68_983520 [compost metagenome]
MTSTAAHAAAVAAEISSTIVDRRKGCRATKLPISGPAAMAAATYSVMSADTVPVSRPCAEIRNG